MDDSASPAHPTFHRLFRPGRLSIGLVMPMTQATVRTTDPAQQFALAALADRLGFAALWLRDVPLNAPSYPDPVGHLDPWVHLGALAAHTRSIALVTGAIVSSLRHPLHVAKAAMSADVVSNGRLILGLGSGDRPAEFAAFGQHYPERARHFRQYWEKIAAALQHPSRILPDEGAAQEASQEAFEMRPGPAYGSVPLLTVGSAQQTLEWIARNANGWVTYHRPLEVQRGRFTLWRNAVDRVAPGTFRSFSSAFSLRLQEDADAAPEPIALGYRLGRKALVDMLEQHRDMGVHHVMFNLTDTGRPVGDILEELAQEVLPLFHRD
jgi:luciferase-type oxidoreductase